MRSELPEGWVSGQLGDHADILVGFAFKSAQFTDDPSGIRLLRGDNVGQGRLRWHGARRWPANAWLEFEHYTLQAHDAVLAMDRPWIDAGLKYATVRTEDVPCLLVQRVARLRGTTTLAQRFLPYVIGDDSFTQYVLSSQTGTTVPHISGGQIAAFRLALPPIAEQWRIAEVLGAFDCKIDSNRRLTIVLDKLCATLFERTDAKPGSCSVVLGDYVELVSGHSYATKDLDDPDETIGLLTLKAVQGGGGFSPDGIRRYSGRFATAQIANPGDIIVAHTDLTQRATVLGRPAMIRSVSGYEKLVASMHVPIVRPRDKRLPTTYLYHLLLSPDFHEYARSRSHGSTVMMLNKRVLPEFTLQLPKPEALEEFHATVTLLMQLACRLQAESESLANMRDTLLPKLISGEIRVPDTTDPEEVIGPAAEALVEART